MDTDIGTSIRAAASHFRVSPESARITDSTATATIDGGLRCRVAGPNGWELWTDMHPTFGGESAAALPSWVLRAAIASCTATTVVMRAAELDVELTDVSVEVESDTDLRGMLGIGQARSEPLQVRVRISLEGDASRECLEDIARWGAERSPVGATIERPVEVSLELRAGGRT